MRVELTFVHWFFIKMIAFVALPPYLTLCRSVVSCQNQLDFFIYHSQFYSMDYFTHKLHNDKYSKDYCTGFFFTRGKLNIAPDFTFFNCLENHVKMS